MKKELSAVVTGLCLLFSGISEAKIGNAFCEDYCKTSYCTDEQNNYYMEIFGGANFMQTNSRHSIKSSFKTGYAVAASVGYKWCWGLRFEAEYAFRRNRVKSVHYFGKSFGKCGHYQASSYMANLLWDIPLQCWGLNLCGIRPFVGGGIGWDYEIVHARYHHTNFRNGKKHFAWQAMTGLTMPFYCNTDVSVEYRYHQGGMKHLHNHTVGLGLKYNFPIFF